MISLAEMPSGSQLWVWLLLLTQVGALLWYLAWCFRPTEWSTTSGVVTRVAVETQEDGKRRYYLPKIDYTYTARTGEEAGAFFSNDRFWWIQYRYDDEAMAAAKLRLYTPGTTVTVQYNPGNPQDAVVSVSPSVDPFFSITMILMDLGTLAALEPRSPSFDNPGWLVLITLFNAFFLYAVVDTIRSHTRTLDSD